MNTQVTTYSDMEPCSVGLLLRNGDDGTALRSIHFRVEQDAGNAVDATQNDLVVYAMNPGSEMIGPAPTVA